MTASRLTKSCAGVVREEGAGALDERAAAGVGVGIAEEELGVGLGRDLFERGEERVGFGGGVLLEGDGVVGDEERGGAEVEATAGFDFFAGEQRAAAEVIERGCAGAMDAPGFFAHGDDALRGRRRSK